MTTRSFQLTICSKELRPLVTTSVNCSSVHITHINQECPYVTLITIQVISTSNQICCVSVNSLLIPIHLNNDLKRHQEMIRWIEKPVGDTLRRNGDSAYTNYFRLYQSLITHFTVDIVSTNERVGQTTPNACICFSKCDSCSRIIRILSEKRQITDNEVKIIPVFKTCSLRYKGKTLQRVGSCLYS